MKSNPKFSVVIPLYNKQKSIKDTVTSVLNQTYTDFELLVIDDGSTDDSVKTLSEIKDERLHVISKTNGGVSDARNFGIKSANFDYIFFLDADDYITPDCLSVFAALIGKYEHLSIFTANFKVVQPNGKEHIFCRSTKEYAPENPIRDLWMKKIFLRTGAMVVHKKCFEKVGYFQKNLCLYEDLDLIVRLLAEYKVAYSPALVMAYQNEFSDLSKKVVRMDQEFAFSINLNDTSLYERLLLSENIFSSYQSRKKAGDQEGSKFLLDKNKKYVPSIVLTIIGKKFINLLYKSKVFLNPKGSIAMNAAQ